MGRFVKGAVVVVPFPFTDLTHAKRRPALVLAGSTDEDVILCQITSRAVKDHRAILLTSKDVLAGTLRQDSYARPNRLFTADQKIILYQVGHLRPEKMEAVTQAVVRLFTDS